MKLPKLTSFFLIFFFFASFLAQARRLQENYEDDQLKKAKSSYQPLSISSATYNGDFLLTLRLELPKSLSLQDSQSFFERFNGVVEYMLTLTSLSSTEFGREAKSPPPSPKPSDPIHPTIIPSGLSSAGEFGRDEKSPPPAPETDIPDHPTITASSYGRPARSPPPAPKPAAPIHPGNGGGGGAQVVSMADDDSSDFLASA